ncbi:Thioredoxin-like [Marivirga sericea]|uniref:Thioredoxin-like n=1 Tax=Marivirga sericea TaxID=1028 RepID=A0A1X7L688_9BACT|nr:thioredoxin family protein [Marivirga sericea]SMG49270.1 Thioredoxin-like [Marivirga sericea]
MKIILIATIALLLFSCNNDTNKASIVNINATTGEQNLIVVDQDYMKAKEIASEEGKLLFIDFYTTWCAPCKQLDKFVFQKDSITQILSKDFVLLKYDAENDTIFHLAKKHHVSSYPTAIVLNQDGYVVNRKYGFLGDDFQTLSQSVMDFTNEAITLDKGNKYLKGYSNTIEETRYPQFYIDYVNRTNTKPQTSSIVEFLNSKTDFFKEEDFTPLFYFGQFAPANVGDIIVKDKERYFDLYGKQDVELLLFFITSGKFSKAIAENSQEKYNEAVAFAKQALSQDWVDDILPRFEIDLLKAQNKWDEVFTLYEERKNRGDLSEGELNHFCWGVYKNCDDKEVISKAVAWMKELTERKPEYLYLDTYAYLLYKSGDLKKTGEVIRLGLKTAEEEKVSAKSMEKLLKKL